MSSGRERLRLWALVLSRVELPLGAQTDPPFLGGGWVCAAQGGRGIFPDARQGRPGVAGRHPRTSQPGGITDRGKDDVHGSSLCGSCRHTWSLSPGRGLAGAARIIGSGGVSLSFGNCRLTRSNHRSYAGMSGKEGVDSRAKGGSQSAHSSTRKDLRVPGGSCAESLPIICVASPAGDGIPRWRFCTISP